MTWGSNPGPEESTAADLTGVKSPTFEYEAAQAVKALLDGLDLPSDKKAAVAMVAAVLLVGEMPGIVASGCSSSANGASSSTILRASRTR